jgi:Zn-dependent peptidase ImmA (M78 family)
MLCDHYLGLKPFLYGRDLLKRMKTKGHYVNEYDVMDFLGYEVQTVKPEDYSEFDDTIGEIFDDICALTFREQSKILLSSSISPKRQRLTLFHEAGHEVLPFHDELTFSIRGKDLDPITHKLMEREAFWAGSEIMYPVKHFVDDMMALPMNFAAINQLANRYNGSFEATCIRYALTSLGRVAIVVVKENDLNQIIVPQNYRKKERYLFDMSRFTKSQPLSTAPLRVQYCSHSYNFPKFIKSGAEIEPGNIIYDTWIDKQYRQGEIPASVFGSSAKFKYFAECLPYFDRVFVLLWLTNRQMDFFKGVVL